MKVLHPFDFRSEFISGKSVIHFKDFFFVCRPINFTLGEIPKEGGRTFSKKVIKNKKEEQMRKIVFLSFEELFHYDSVLRDR